MGPDRYAGTRIGAQLMTKRHSAATAETSRSPSYCATCCLVVQNNRLSATCSEKSLGCPVVHCGAGSNHSSGRHHPKHHCGSTTSASLCSPRYGTCRACRRRWALALRVTSMIHSSTRLCLFPTTTIPRSGLAVSMGRCLSHRSPAM